MDLRYIDFISCSEQMRNVLRHVEDTVGARIKLLEAPKDQSGPKIEEAVSTFAAGRADIGRI